jgi:hypothetical protein
LYKKAAKSFFKVPKEKLSPIPLPPRQDNPTMSKYRSTKTAWRVTQWTEIPPTSGAHLFVGLEVFRSCTNGRKSAFQACFEQNCFCECTVPTQWRLVRVGKVGAAYPDFAKGINLFKLKFINKYSLITLKCNF